MRISWLKTELLRKELLETVTAFANTQGETIIIGNRDSDRLIVGLDRKEIERYILEIPQAIADAVAPQIAVDLYEQHLLMHGPDEWMGCCSAVLPKTFYIRFGQTVCINMVGPPLATCRFTCRVLAGRLVLLEMVLC